MMSLITEQPATLPKVWDVYTKCVGHGVCSLCQETILTKNGSTTALHNHMRDVHKITTFKRRGKAKGIDAQSVVSNMEALNRSFPLEAKVSRMVAKDRLTFNSLKTSNDIREGISATVKDSAKLPESDKSIKDLVMSFGDRVRQILSLRLQEKIKNGEYFSIDFDEWKSVANRRYINLNIFDKSTHFWNLGLVRITGPATANNLLNLVNERISQFGLDPKRNIVAFITDGCRVMEALHENSEIEHQLCLAHGIQLAVTDVLYSKKSPKRKSKGKGKKILEAAASSSNSGSGANCAEQEDLDISDSDIHVNDDEIEDDGLNDIEEEEEANSRFETVVDEVPKDVKNKNCLIAINKVRKIVSHFKRSGVDKEKLEALVKLKFGHDKSVILDCRTRWTSLYNMIARYNEIQDCIDNVMKEIKIDDAKINPCEKYLLLCLENSLKPVKDSVENLCRRDLNLIEAEEALKVLFYTLAKQNNPLSRELLHRLQVRIEYRWTCNAKVLKYLHLGNSCDDKFDQSFLSSYDEPEISDDSGVYNQIFDGFDQSLTSYELELKIEKIFSVPERKVVHQHLLSLIKRLCPPDPTTLQEISNEVIDEIVEPATKKAKLTFKELQNEAILRIRNRPLLNDRKKQTPLSRKVTQEMNFLEKNSARGSYLEKVYNMLITIKATSVESERCFSSASLICTKIRARFNDSTLDTVSFLRTNMINPLSCPL